MTKAKKTYEDTISKQLKKFEIAESKLQKRMKTTKKELTDQIQINKSLVDQLKYK